MRSPVPDDCSVERELKFRAPDLGSLRFALEAEGAERLTEASLEDSLLFDRDGVHAARGEVVRLRVDGSGVRLTFKGPATFEGGVKEREELETGIVEANVGHRGDESRPHEALERAQKILEALGYEPQVRYQKVREEWRFQDVVIALDHTPMGNFVEFEGPLADVVASRFGFEPETALRETYLGLWRLHRESQRESGAASLPLDMTFPDESEARWPV